MARPLLTAIDTRRLSTSPADLDSSDGRRSSTPPFMPLAKRGDGVTVLLSLTRIETGTKSYLIQFTEMEIRSRNYFEDGN